MQPGEQVHIITQSPSQLLRQVNMRVNNPRHHDLPLQVHHFRVGQNCTLINLTDRQQFIILNQDIP